MKTLIISIALLIALPLSAQVKQEVMTMVHEKEFFRLAELVSTNSIDELSQTYAEAITNNAFGKNEESIAGVNKLITSGRLTFSDSVYTRLMEVQIDNYYKTSNFKEAAAATVMLLQNGAGALDSAEVADLKNSGVIWTALSSSPVPALEHAGATTLGFTRDMARLINIPVQRNGTETKAIFDTGANISVMSERTAGKYQLNFIADNIEVQSITGSRVMARLGIADRITIGDIVIRNAYFLVFKDSDLSFAGGIYKIDLIIGFPIIRAMGEVQFDLAEKRILINGSPRQRNFSNLCLDGLTPIVQMKLGDKPINMAFDSGADKTIFYPKFLELVKNDAAFSLTPGTTTLGGAGGTRKINVLTLDKVQLEVAGKTVSLGKCDILPVSLEDKEQVYGNMGQDVLNSHGKFTINLDKMYFELSN